MISPEPWELSVEGDIIFDAAGFPVAIKPTFSGASGDMRLMCSAPALYAALKAMFDRWEPDCVGTDRQMWEDAREVLAEIEGNGQ